MKIVTKNCYTESNYSLLGSEQKRLIQVFGMLSFSAHVMFYVEFFSNAQFEQGEKELPKHWAREKCQTVENLLVSTEKLDYMVLAFLF